MIGMIGMIVVGDVVKAAVGVQVEEEEEEDQDGVEAEEGEELRVIVLVEELRVQHRVIISLDLVRMILEDLAIGQGMMVEDVVKAAVGVQVEEEEEEDQNRVEVVLVEEEGEEEEEDRLVGWLPTSSLE